MAVTVVSVAASVDVGIDTISARKSKGIAEYGNMNHLCAPSHWQLEYVYCPT
jgi:hypothetical protein